MIDYELLDIRTLPDPQEDPASLISIPEWRKSYILRYRLSDDRRRSLGAWRLLEKMLLKHGFSADGVSVGENGKPVCEGIYFNLSHSGNTVLCVVSDTPVGCDIEQVGSVPLKVAERVFTPKERRYIDREQVDSSRAFFRLWTMKESYLKMTGEGLKSVKKIEVDPETASVLRNGVPQPCKIQNISIDGYEISLCFLKL